jgi:hypothetical protein
MLIFEVNRTYVNRIYVKKEKRRKRSVSIKRYCTVSALW